ncbi:ribonuclease HII [Candidatus Dependentiae bacterium]|nr:ribonuclease HII [Candidatus Dependentiae bacterium]
MNKKIKYSFKKDHFEKLAWQKNKFICGIDEVGRGCLAGPLITCAAILPLNAKHKFLKDSKKLDLHQRKIAYKWLTKNCYYSIAISSNKMIDKLNIYQATLFCMKKSFIQILQIFPTQDLLESVCIDAMPLNLSKFDFCKSIKFHYFDKGEDKSSSIAAASIIAKVFRDKLMVKISNSFSCYNFSVNKGYGTTDHLKNLVSYKESLIHRKTFLSNFKYMSNNEQTKQQTIY